MSAGSSACVEVRGTTLVIVLGADVQKRSRTIAAVAAVADEPAAVGHPRDHLVRAPV
jgi:hypothetical protein